MPSPDVLDFAKLLAPIPGDKPAGVDLRTDPSPVSLYYTIKDARNKARDVERVIAKADDPASIPPPDWRPVLQDAMQVLAEKTKDLEVTAYVIEALLRLHHFCGLRDGFRLARELCERFWDGIFPLPDEDGLGTRVAALAGLNGEGGGGSLIAPINRVALTDSPELGRLSMADYMQVESLAKVNDVKVREKRIAAGSMTLERFEKAVAETPPPFYAMLVGDLTGAIEEFAKLTAELGKRCGDRAPPSTSIRDALTKVLDVVKNVARAKLSPPATADGAAAPADGAAAAATAPGPGQPVEFIRTREDALRVLLKVVDFFRRTEPHNPVSYAVEQAARWAQMPLPELLVELIPDEAPRKGLFNKVGIKPPEPPAPASGATKR